MIIDKHSKEISGFASGHVYGIFLMTEKNSLTL